MNSPFAELRPCLAPDGLLLFWYSRRPEWVFGTIDLWMMRRASRGAPWDPPVNLGPIVDSPNGDCRLCLAPDGSALYFVRVSDTSITFWMAPVTAVGVSDGAPVQEERNRK